MVNRYVFLAWVIASVLLPAAIAQEQPERRLPPLPEDWATRVVNLAHLDAYEAAGAIEKLRLSATAAAMSETTLVLRGTPDALKMIVDDMLTALDMPKDAGSSRMETVLLPLGNIRTETLMPALSTVTRGTSTRVAIDEATRVLVIRGTSDAIAEMKTLVEQLDKPSQPLTLQFFFIRANVKDIEEDEATPLPSALASVGKVLKDNGLRNPSLITPIIVVAEQGQEFKSDSLLRAVYDEGTLEESLSFEVSGRAGLQSKDNRVHVDVRARIRGNYVDVGGGVAAGDTHFDASTMIAAKLGSYTVLAAAPSSTALGDTIALVIRATTDNE